MTQAHSRDFKNVTPRFTLRDGSVLKIFKNPVGVDHVFIADDQAILRTVLKNEKKSYSSYKVQVLNQNTK